MKLEVDSELVRKAAEKCPTSKSVLKEIFPEAFRSEIKAYKFTIEELYNESTPTIAVGYEGRILLTISKDGVKRSPLGNLSISGLPFPWENTITGFKIRLNE